MLSNSRFLVLTICIALISLQFAFKQFKFYNNRYIYNKKLKCHPVVAFTRELGANDALINLLPDLNCLELPCIQFENTSRYRILADVIASFDLIALTSPHSASLFVNSWKSIGKPPVKVVTVGKGTSSVLIKNGIIPVFEPINNYTAASLSSELPSHLGKSILYPTSELADDKLQAGLKSRRFEVDRLNIYTTVPSNWTSDQFNMAKRVNIVSFASPSAVRIWAKRCTEINRQVAVSIGPTTAKAAKEAGFYNSYEPISSKGLEAWANEIRKVVDNYKQIYRTNDNEN